MKRIQALIGGRSSGSVKSRGFTLIELLIVVTIISILAAISLPNLFLAQTRSKVSRAMSDMRTIAVALEAYYTDYNTYPEDYAASSPQAYGMGRLTSPTSYLSSIPLDPFGGYFDRERRVHVKSYTLGTAPEFKPVRWAMASVGPNTEDDTSPLFDYPGYSADLWENPDSGFKFFRYDPTNGTLSPGDIIRVSDFRADW